MIVDLSGWQKVQEAAGESGAMEHWNPPSFHPLHKAELDGPHDPELASGQSHQHHALQATTHMIHLLLPRSRSKRYATIRRKSQVFFVMMGICIDAGQQVHVTSKVENIFVM